MRRGKLALRLQASLLGPLRRVTETEDYFRERAARADVVKVKRILKRAGRGNPPTSGDELH